MGVACEDSVVGRWLTLPSSPLLAIAAMTVVVGVSVVIVVLDVESRTHLCAITFFGFACGVTFLLKRLPRLAMICVYASYVDLLRLL